MQIADKGDVAIVILRYLTKRTAVRAIYRGGGSIGISGAAWSVLLVQRAPGKPDRDVLASTKSNLGVPPTALAGSGTGAAWVERLGGHHGRRPREAAREDCEL